MIFDDIKNIRNYSEVDEKIADFILNLTAMQECGKVFLSEDRLTYANVDEYTTKTLENCKLEAHKKYIDIQILLDGVEELDYINVEGLKVKEAYIPERDIMFFDTPEKVLNRIILETGKFVLLYPHEAHQPQMAYKNIPSKVKKVVVKIPVCHSEPA